MHLNKKISAIILATSLSMISVISAFANPSNPKTGNFTWTKADGGWICSNENGTPVSGWILYEEKTYYLDKNGVMKTGWQKDNGTWYYLDQENGHLLTNKWIDNYYVNSDGEMVKIK